MPGTGVKVGGGGMVWRGVVVQKPIILFSLAQAEKYGLHYQYTVYNAAEPTPKGIQIFIRQEGKTGDLVRYEIYES